MCQYKGPGNKHWDITWKAAGISARAGYWQLNKSAQDFWEALMWLFGMVSHLPYITSGMHWIFFNTTTISALEIPTEKKERDSSISVYFICPSEAISSVLIYGPHLKMLSSYFAIFHDNIAGSYMHCYRKKKRNLILWFKFQKHCSFDWYVDLGWLKCQISFP